MSERLVLITGATTGIGRAAAEIMARRGALVAIHGRDPERVRQAREEIERSTGAKTAGGYVADLSSQEQVREMAERFAREQGELHVLVNNAGTLQRDRRTTGDGTELTFSVNTLAPFLLTTLLLEPLRRGSPSRVVNVTSHMQFDSDLDPADLMPAKRYDAVRAYSDSKLALTALTFELARRMYGKGVSANCLHPGAVATEIAREGPETARAFYRLSRSMLLTPLMAGRYVAHLALSPELEGATGQYWEQDSRAVPPRVVLDASFRRKVWDACEALIRPAPGMRMGRSMAHARAVASHR